MTSRAGSVWAVDIGNNSLKALQLSNERGFAEVVGFDNIPHGKVLTGLGVKASERQELIALSLRRFVENNSIAREGIAISVTSQNSFARFVNLPPVESKKIPELVRFEATQQIPFDINEVQWDWQLMEERGGRDNRVGIFAIKSEVVNTMLGYFDSENLTVTHVQMAPMALYNYAMHDRPELAGSENQAVIVLDIGAENADLVVCTPSTVWQRCIPMGGNAFTRAIAEAFKLDFQKAEKLKRTAPMSKYARQVFQAMRPVFTDLVSEIQRSLNFYGSSNPNTKMVKVVAMGGGTKMRGLLKYLRQTLQMPVENLDSFKKLAMAPGVSAAKFHENVADFGVVYGLGLQALGLGKIESNLLPKSIARSMVWAGKTKYFAVAASMLLLVSLMSFARTTLDKLAYERNMQTRMEVTRVIDEAGQARSKLDQVRFQQGPAMDRIAKAFGPFEYRDVVPKLYEIIVSNLPDKKNNPEQAELYGAFIEGDVEGVRQVPRKQRKQLFITGMSVKFVNDVETATFEDVEFISGAPQDKKGTEEMEMDADEIEYMQLQAMQKFQRRQWTEPGVEAEAAEEGGPGFLVILEGYSPYRNVGELIDPLRVEDTPEKWGLATRLLHLADANGPFELYKKTETKHFNLEIGEVDLEAEKRPAGVGVAEYRPVAKGGRLTAGTEETEPVLIDPMTKEIISKVIRLDKDGSPQIDPKGRYVYEVHDHWFALKLKLLWKDAPRDPEAEAAGLGMLSGRYE
jgi:type IV pilus assembly protein PilM